MSSSVETCGWITGVRLANGKLFLEGWALSAAGVVDGFRVEWAGGQFDIIHLERGRPSQTVVEYFPQGLAGINADVLAHCGFLLGMPVPQEQEERIRHSLIRVVPLVGG